MVPLGSLVTVKRGYGPEQVMHYNGFPAAEINGAAAPGFSSGQGQNAIADVLREKLPAGMAFEWTELAYQEILSGNTMLLIFPLCVLLVYVVLAAQYESWTLPLSVILIVPMTILSAIVGVWVTGGDNNVFTQIAFLVLAGLACKNAILIVEFAKHREEQGDDRVTAILEACRVRLRPVLMTSIAFIMGVLPLVFSSGAGFEIRQAMGVAVFAGMLGVTLFGLFLTPVFFTVLGNLVERFKVRRTVPATATAMLAMVLFLGGCTLRPYQAPEIAPVAVKNAVLFDRKPYDPHWWKQFEDPVLDALAAAALEANHDLRMALARFDQSRAFFQDVHLDRYPTVTAGALYDRREVQQVETTTYQAGFDAFWELDLFGRVRSQIQSARANAESFEASLQDVRVIIAAEVARNYFELRGLQQQLSVAERSLLNQRETLRLTTVRRDAGVGEELDVARAAALLAGSEATLPPLRTAIAERMHRLAVLTGRRPGELVVDLSPRDYPPLAKALPLGEVDTFLQRRPDVRAAERRLAAATAGEGIAAADLYPRITITGFLGFLAGRGNLLFESDSRAWAVTPALSWAAFDLGSARARLRGAEAGTREALALYEQTILRALEETENAFVSYSEQQQRLVKLTDQARESARASAIARARYREGVADFLSLLDAERTQLQAESAVAQAEAQVFTSVVGVYKALGGI
jgi:NodT family efflux transporter outer membrane factor (OMF) lipoprotein